MTRRKARTTALQALYEIDSSRHDAQATLDRLIQEQRLTGDLAEFTSELVRGVIKNRNRIDKTIMKYAPAFPVDQIAVIDRNILRLAIYEILIDNKVPVKAAINEAVDLAKSFGSDASPKFVNGVLGSVASEVTG